MRKICKAIIISFVLFCSFSVNANAKTEFDYNELIDKTEPGDITDINDLIENAKTLDGQEVIVQGEAIGERMDRGDYTWVNINDGTNAIGVWLKKSEAEKIMTYGNYKYIGDTIQVSAVFYRACNEHGGEPDLHAISISIVKEGYSVNKQVSHTKIVAAIVLCIIALILVLVRFKIIKRRNILNQNVQEPQD